jgi:hypothetical protein
MLSFLPNAYVEALIWNVIVFGSWVFGKWSGYKDRSLMIGFQSLQEKTGSTFQAPVWIVLISISFITWEWANYNVIQSALQLLYLEIGLNFFSQP